MPHSSGLDLLASPAGPGVLPADFDGEHPVIDMPFSAIVDGRLFEGDGISLVGARAHGLVSPQLDGEQRLVTLVFPFAGFNVTLPVEARIETASAASGKLVLRFTSPAGPHLPQLRHLLNSFIAGDITDMRSVLSTSSGPAGSASVKPSGSRGAGQLGAALLKGLLITVASLALFGYVGSKIYERAFVAHAQGISLLGKDSTALRSVNSGQLDFVDPTAVKGAVAYAVRTVSGDLVSVTMPCDCTILPGALSAGATVLAGDTVMRLALPDATTQVEARIGIEGYRALAQGRVAKLELPGGGSIPASLKTGAVPAPSADNADAVDVVLVPQGPVDDALIGTPVSISIETAPFSQAVDSVRALVGKGMNP